MFEKILANENSSRECSLRRKGQYKAKLELSPTDDFIEEKNKHTQRPSQVEYDATKIKGNIKKRAQTTEHAAQNIFSAELDHLPQAAAVDLPSTSALRRSIRHAREDKNVHEKPLNRAEVLVIPQEY